MWDPAVRPAGSRLGNPATGHHASKLVLPCHDRLPLSSPAPGTRMAAHGEVVLRQRVCRGIGCHAVFWICQHCDRGQRYCSPACRADARAQQRRCANGRHQRSPEGRLDHRDRQREYRHRQACRARVTDQGSHSIASPALCGCGISRSTRVAVQSRSSIPLVQRWPERRFALFLRCVICGRSSHFVDPFPRIPRSG